MKRLETTLVFPISLFTIMNPMNDQAPATKGDIRSLEVHIRSLEAHIDRVLAVVVNIDNNLKATKDDHGRRIVRLEKAVF